MKNKLKYVSIIMFLLLMLLTVKSNAVLKMEIKPGTTAWTNMNVSESYDYCYNLRNSDTTLGESNLDPHLTLNKDWGAVAYLAVSPYGNVTDKSGPTTNINGQTYRTTTGNATGVLSFGSVYVQTSAVFEDVPINNSTTTSLIRNINTRYVEKLNKETSIENTKGQAINETSGWFSSNAFYNGTASSAILHRMDVFGYYLNDRYWGYGGPSDQTTFRPVIWNIK